jgi:hypothetical protein
MQSPTGASAPPPWSALSHCWVCPRNLCGRSACRCVDGEFERLGAPRFPEHLDVQTRRRDTHALWPGATVCDDLSSPTNLTNSGRFELGVGFRVKYGMFVRRWSIIHPYIHVSRRFAEGIHGPPRLADDLARYVDIMSSGYRISC